MSAKDETMEADDLEAPGKARLPEKDEYAPSPSLIAVAPAPEQKSAQQPGTNRFAKWDSCAAIRSKPRQRMLKRHADGSRDLTYFSPDLVPVSRHPLVVERQLSRQVQIQHLYSYLWFTTVLEQQYVNPIMIRIATGNIGLSIPKSMLVDAHRIYCDEGYHALCAVDLAQQAEECSGVASRVDASLPKPFRDLNRLVERTPDALRRSVELAFVIISETLVSSILTRSHLDPRVEPAIRQVILEHAQDEAVHQAYFADLTRLIWPLMDPSLRLHIGQLIPELILTFLRPDLGHIADALIGMGLLPQEAERVVSDCYPRAEILGAARFASTYTIGLFRSLGALDDTVIQRSFLASGLLNPAPEPSAPPGAPSMP
jgi:hypothetical protein